MTIMTQKLDDFSKMERSSVFTSLVEMAITSNTDQLLTPKSQMQEPPTKKRWASVVKAQKKSLSSSKLDSKQNDSQTGTIAEIFNDRRFKTFPEGYENHKGFISEQRNVYTCSVCSVELESVLNLANHLKTRKHEDNIIFFLKDKLPIHLHHVMEYVSFCGSELCCNLCCNKINMSSDNPFKTIVNIVAHNSDSSHTGHKTIQEHFNIDNNLIKSLETVSKDIEENLHFIEKKMVPQFQCKLCNKLIVHNGDGKVLTQSLSAHLRSMEHIKNEKANEVLSLFGEVSNNAKDNFYILNGNITCIYCNHQVETNVENMVIHINGAEHVSNMFANIGIASSLNNVSEITPSSKKNQFNEAKLLVSRDTKKDEVENGNCQQPRATTEHSESRLNNLLSTLPSSLKHSGCMIENDKGSVTCLICDRVVPPSTYNIKTHLLGNSHKKKEEVILQSPENTERLSYIIKDAKGVFNSMVCRCSITPSTDYFHKHFKSLHHKQEEGGRLEDCFDCPLASSLLEKIPVVIKALKCHKPEKIPSSVLDQLFTLLLKKSALVLVNIDFLVKNVDGKHTYCKLCKILIPLSLDFNILENSIVVHLKGKRHNMNLSWINDKVTLTPKEETQKTGNVVRSLFLPNSNVNECEDNETSRVSHNKLLLPQTRNIPIIKEVKSAPNENNKKAYDKLNAIDQGQDGTLITSKNEVFIFGKEDGSNKTDAKQIGRSSLRTFVKGLPVTKIVNIPKNETETNEEILIRRQKQIDYGKNTEGYFRYYQSVPQHKRRLCHPVTPPRHLKCSRRTWDGLVRAWRKQLHLFDPPNISSCVESDIQPLK